MNGRHIHIISRSAAFLAPKIQKHLERLFFTAASRDH